MFIQPLVYHMTVHDFNVAYKEYTQNYCYRAYRMSSVRLQIISYSLQYRPICSTCNLI